MAGRKEGRKPRKREDEQTGGKAKEEEQRRGKGERQGKQEGEQASLATVMDHHFALFLQVIAVR